MITVTVNVAKIGWLDNSLEVKQFDVITEKKLNQKQAKSYVGSEQGFKKIVFVENTKTQMLVNAEDLKIKGEDK